MDKQLATKLLSRGLGACLLLYIAGLVLVWKGPLLACCPVNFQPLTTLKTQSTGQVANPEAREYALLPVARKQDSN